MNRIPMAGSTGRAAALAAALLLLAAAGATAQQARLSPNRGFTSVQNVLGANCAACHSWASTHGGIVDPERVVPRDPGASLLYQRAADGSMPPAGPRLGVSEVALLQAWIAAGAPPTDDPLPVFLVDATSAATGSGTGQPAADATGAASPAEGTAAAAGPARAGTSSTAKKILFHKVSGFTSGGLLLAAGIIGGVHLLDMMEVAHQYQETYDQDSPQCRAAMLDAWRGDQAMRWVHVSLFSAGEVLYLADAITGISMLTPDRPGLTKQDIHRYAFFTHVTLMAAELVLGFLATDALQKGGHDTMLAVAAAHAGIGIAIPVIMLGAGAYAVMR